MEDPLVASIKQLAKEIQDINETNSVIEMKYIIEEAERKLKTWGLHLTDCKDGKCSLIPCDCPCHQSVRTDYDCNMCGCKQIGW